MIHSHRIVHFCGPKTEMVQGGTCADPECQLVRAVRDLAEARELLIEALKGWAEPSDLNAWEARARQALEAKP